MNTPIQDVDERINFKRSAMVLFALEQSLGSYVRENVSELGELPAAQTKKFTDGPKKVQTVESLVQKLMLLRFSTLRFLRPRWSVTRHTF